uniref:Uncharacterized protein n=1 Tax=viral metagenome TaxID=1070528 RepID=A0A6C0CRP3_9ZZZZ
MQSKYFIAPPSTKLILPILRRPVYRKPFPNVYSISKDNNIKTLYETLNNKEDEDYKNYVKSTLSQWKPMKRYTSKIAYLKNPELELLFTLYRHYVPPLESFEKIVIRNKLLYFLTNSKTDEDCHFYHSILDYYDLIEDC